MAGAASSALFKKVKRMKSSNQNGHQAKLEIPVSPNAGIQSHGLRSFMERRDSVSEICEETGFVRLVYRQARSLKDKTRSSLPQFQRRGLRRKARCAGVLVGLPFLGIRESRTG